MAKEETTQVIVLQHDPILGSRYVLQEIQIEEESQIEEEE
jgi:hypothetical protein